MSDPFGGADLTEVRTNLPAATGAGSGQTCEDFFALVEWYRIVSRAHEYTTTISTGSTDKDLFEDLVQLIKTR